MADPQPSEGLEIQYKACVRQYSDLGTEVVVRQAAGFYTAPRRDGCWPRWSVRSPLLVAICLACLPSPLCMVRVDAQDNADGAGVIEGLVTYLGDVPRAKVRDNAGEQRKLLVVDRRSRGLRYALVYLDHDGPSHPDASDSEVEKSTARPDPVVIDQLEHTFQPHLIAIRDGQKVKFTNSDAANHNVRAIAFESKNEFNVFTGAGGEYIHPFVAGKKLRPTTLSCDIHPWMRGWIYVFQHPYFAVTDELGKFRIRSVPAGEHRLVIWQPDVGYRETLRVDVKAQETTTVKMQITPDDLPSR